MEDIIEIKCPFDGAVLRVKNFPGIEEKYVTCPVCKQRYRFTEFKRVTLTSAGSSDPDTEYPDGSAKQGDQQTLYGGQAGSDAPAQNYTLGILRVLGSGEIGRLKPGRNVVGRKGKKSEADFQIDTGDNRSMSREHIVIEVKKLPAKGFVHYLSLYKQMVNRTLVNKELLQFGDCVVLNHGDMIQLPDATLRFEIPDGEETEC